MKYLLFVAFFFLYLIFRSVQCEVIEALCLEDGYLFPPNHLLYRPIGAFLYKLAQAFGYQGRSVYVLQLLNVFYGAIGVTLLYAALLRLRAASWAALAASILLGTSHIYWSHSTDATYIVLVGAFTAAALFCAALFIEKRSTPAALGVAFFLALAILTWQASIFLIPVFLLLFRRNIYQAILFVFVSFTIVAGVNTVIGFSQGANDATDLLHWMRHYAGGNLPIWGTFEFSRIPEAGVSAVRSIHQFPTIAGIFQYPFLIRIIYLFFGLILSATLFQTIRRALQKDYLVIWLSTAYLSLWPFIIWWAPAEIRWFFVANIFLCGILGLVWSSWINTNSGKITIFGAVISIAILTCYLWIWPKHNERGVIARKTECIAKNAHSADLMIAPDWNWTADLRYFYRIQTLDIIHFGANFQNSNKLFNYIHNEVHKTYERGGRVFIVDPSSYSPQYLKWLADQTTFTPTDFQRFSGEFSFQCEGTKFREVTSLN